MVGKNLRLLCINIEIVKPPPINTPYDKAWPAVVTKGVKKNNERIKLIFKIAGANAPAAKRSWTLLIEVK